MIDFILDNPFILIFLLYGLVSLLTKKKGQQKTEARRTSATARREPATARSQPATTRPSTLANVEQSLLRVMEQADREFSSRVSEPSAESAPLVSGPASTSKSSTVLESTKGDDPFAFRSLMHGGESQRTSLEAGSKDYDVDATDYDITAKDYDVTAIDYDTQTSGYGFHAAVDEPVEKEYHLTGFQEFHTGHGFTDKERERAIGEAAYAEVVPEVQVGFSPDDIRRAIVMQEILGKPRSRR